MNNIVLKISNFFKKDLFRKLIYLLVASSGLFLLVNKYPYFGILSILAMLFLGILFLFYRGSVTSVHLGVIGTLAAIYIYFILSYFISNQTLSNFLSYDFLRYDGNFFFCYIPFFALAVPFFDYEKVSRLYFNFIFFTFSILSIAGIIGMLTGNYSYIFLLNEYESPMLAGLNNAHNATGSVYALASIFALAFILKSQKKIKIYYGVVLLLCLAGLVMTQSRGSYIGFIIGALLVIWLHFRSILKFAITTIIIAAVSIPLIFFTNLRERFIKMLDFTDIYNYAILGRLNLWGKALYLFRQSPVFGVGFGRFNDVSYTANDYGYTLTRVDEFSGIPKIFYTYHAPNYDFSAAHAHNSYLQFLAETGIIGLGLIIFFWILCYRFILRAYNQTSNEFPQKVYLSCLGSIAVLFAMSFTENYFSAATMIMCLSVVTSLSLGLYWQESRNKVK
jgi:O-antigen ligase